MLNLVYPGVLTLSFAVLFYIINVVIIYQYLSLGITAHNSVEYKLRCKNVGSQGVQILVEMAASKMVVYTQSHPSAVHCFHSFLSSLTLGIVSFLSFSHLDLCLVLCMGAYTTVFKGYSTTLESWFFQLCEFWGLNSGL